MMKSLNGVASMWGASLALAAMLAVNGMPDAQAQGLAAGKICQVVRSCNFARGAAVRGCLSSYSCRQCDFRRSAARSSANGGRVVWTSRCTWGASS